MLAACLRMVACWEVIPAPGVGDLGLLLLGGLNEQGCAAGVVNGLGVRAVAAMGVEIAI
jgi:hypothetical protein